MIRYIFAALFVFISTDVTRAEVSLSEMKNAIGGVCPADLRRVSLIDANDKCDPHLSVSKACDSKFQAPSSQWQQCYDDIQECRRQVDQENQTVYDYNDWIAKCTSAAAKRESSNPSPKVTTNGNATSDDFASRLEAAKKRNKQMEETNGKQQQEFSAELAQKLQDNYQSFVQKLEQARREEAGLREQYRIERDQMRHVQLMRQLEQQEEARSIAESVLSSFLQGFASGYSSSLPSSGSSYRAPTPQYQAPSSGPATRETSQPSGGCTPIYYGKTLIGC
jgi:hypothetical protein